MTAPGHPFAPPVTRWRDRLAGAPIEPVGAVPWVLSVAAWAVLLRWGAALDPHASADAGASVAGHLRELAAWTVMAVAMMAPLTVPLVRTVADRSLRRRRAVAVAEVLVAYLAVWVCFGAAAHLAADALGTADWASSAGRGRRAAALVLVVAAVWRWTPTYRRARLACHRTRPLAPFSPAADRDCVMFGLFNGLRCLTMCAPVMVALALLPHNVPLAALLTAVALGERSRRLSPSAGAAVLAVLAVVTVAGGWTA